MVTRTDLRRIARARIEDAELLLHSGRLDAAAYLCGYAVETALKARICRTLGWSEFPFTRAEFRDYASYRTHDLNILLHLSGIESKVTARYVNEWSKVREWNPEMRYAAVGTAEHASVLEMVAAARTLVRAL